MKLRVAHCPQVPGKFFTVEVNSLEDARRMMDVLARYDLFQYKNRIKPDYSNMTVLEQYNEGDQEWEAWIDEKTGIDDVEEYFEYLAEGI